jgi:hypothetical protein
VHSFTTRSQLCLLDLVGLITFGHGGMTVVIADHGGASWRAARLVERDGASWVMGFWGSGEIPIGLPTPTR